MHSHEKFRTVLLVARQKVGGTAGVQNVDGRVSGSFREQQQGEECLQLTQQRLSVLCDRLQQPKAEPVAG